MLIDLIGFVASLFEFYCWNAVFKSCTGRYVLALCLRICYAFYALCRSFIMENSVSCIMRLFFVFFISLSLVRLFQYVSLTSLFTTRNWRWVDSYHSDQCSTSFNPSRITRSHRHNSLRISFGTCSRGRMQILPSRSGRF